MSSLQTANLLGFIAAFIGILMFIPQTLRAWRTKNTKSISLVSFILVALASVFWLAYGLILAAAPVILVNSVILVFSLFIVLLKLKYG